MRFTRNHFGYYFFLATILLIGLAFILVLSPQRDLQLLILIALCIIYAATGVIHHLLNHDLVAKIMVEYILIALFGATIGFFIFRGGFGF